MGFDFHDTILRSANITGTFTTADTFTGDSGAAGNIRLVGSTYLTITDTQPIVNPIIETEVITGAPSGATATIDTIETGTKPSYQNVVAYIAEFTSQIDAELVLQGLVVADITDADVLNWLKQACKYGVSAMAETTHYTQVSGDESDRAETWRKSYKEYLTRIKDKPGIINAGDTSQDGGKIRYDFPDLPMGTDITL